ncbi:MAG: hypothetical protein WA087_03240 [Candidatus Saccharimonadales bacterium]
MFYEKIEDLDVKNVKMAMEEHKIAIKNKKIKDAKEMPLTLTFEYGLKALGVSAYWVEEMVEAYQKHQSESAVKPTREESIESAMWWIANKRGVFDQVKIAKAVKKTQAYSPEFKLKLLKFIGKNPVTSFILAALAMVMAMAIGLYDGAQLYLDGYVAMSIITPICMYVVAMSILFGFEKIWKKRI